MRLNETIHTKDLPESENREPVPKGVYLVETISAEVKDTRNKNGQYLNIRFKIVNGDYSGRSVFGMINFKNPSKEAERIGKVQLGELLRACNIEKINDTDQLLNHRITIKVDIQDDPQYGPKNNVVGYKIAEGDSSQRSFDDDNIPF